MIQINPLTVLRATAGRRVLNHKNFLIACDGPTGSGKSYWSLSALESIIPSFNADYICFTIKSFLDKFSSANPGDAFLLDEGEAYSARRGMSEQNEAMGQILSMIRYTRISLITTLPDLGQIDVNFVRLMHYHARTIDFDRRSCPGWMKTRSGAKFKEIAKNTQPGESARNVPMFYPIIPCIVRNKRTGRTYERDIKIKELWLNKPSDDLLSDYERLKDAHFKKTLREAQNKLKFREQKENARMGKLGIYSDDDIEKSKQAEVAYAAKVAERERNPQPTTPRPRNSIIGNVDPELADMMGR